MIYICQYVEEEEGFLLSVTELKLNVIQKEEELLKLAHEIKQKDKEVKEREEALKNEADNLKKGFNNYNNVMLLILFYSIVELKISQNSAKTFNQLSKKKSMELENMKKESEHVKHSLLKKLDEGLPI